MVFNRAISFVVAAAIGAIVVASTETTASAQSAECARLSAQLAQARRSGSSRGSKNFAKWDKAAGEQRTAINRTEAEARRAGCRRTLFGGSKSVCQAYDAKIGRMKANLAKLERGRNRYRAGGDNRTAKRIEVRMRRLGCGQRDMRTARREAETLQAGSQPKKRGLLALLFGGERSQSSARVNQVNLDRGIEPRWAPLGNDDLERRWSYNPRAEVKEGRESFYVPGFSGDYRTLCVRTCDGYYFPVSFRTTRENFARDQAVCAAMCPAGDVRLYVHRNPGEESEDMVSVDGEPYTKLGTAFAYRNAFNPECSCGRVTPGLTTLKVRGDGTGLESITLSGAEFEPRQPAVLRKSLPIPDIKPPLDADPETVISAKGGFNATLMTRAVELQHARPGTRVSSGAAKSVRQVGTSFFADQ